MLDLGLCRVLWNRHLDDDMSRKELVRKIRNDLEINRNPTKEKLLAAPCSID
jgi:hypothetical protein